MALVYVNGELLPEDSPALTAFDHGLVVGDGAFETVLLRHGRPFALRRHLERLNRSLFGLGIPGVDPGEIRSALDTVVAGCGYLDGRIRITVTAGQGPLGSARNDGERTVVIACAPATDVHPSARVQTVPWPRNERGALVGLKTVSYAENAVALAYASERDADEAIFSNLAGNLCEGSGSNVFVVLDGELVTPPLGAGCLAGVTRGLVLELCGGSEREIPMAEFAAERLDEAFLTSAIRGVQPIAAIDGVLSRPAPGPITIGVAERYVELRDANLDP